MRCRAKVARSCRSIRSPPTRARRRKPRFAPGREVLYQATLAHAGFAGIADFVVRVPGASSLGDFHYEVWDAKLARRAKPTHALQLCAYAEMLEALQGRRPAYADVVLSTGRQRLRIDDFFAFYTDLRGAFLGAMERFDPGSPPSPNAGAEHRGWQEAAERWLEERDDLSRVAHLTQLQARRLAAAGIASLGALADSSLSRVAGIEDRVLVRLREQAALQRESAGRVPPRYRVLGEAEVAEGRGLALLPPASAGDLVLDLEGDPLEMGGLEYLWGTAWREPDGRFVYAAQWAHDRAEERAALIALFDALQLRRAQHPDLHVYHYGSYELFALKRLAAREGVGEEVVDALLRAEVFVDLYPIVRHGVRVGEPAYSLKNVERLVRPARVGEVASGMESVAVYDAWRESGEDATPQKSPLLERIRHYNEEDCRSTLELAHWLRERQSEARDRPPHAARAEARRSGARRARRVADPARARRAHARANPCGSGRPNGRGGSLADPGAPRGTRRVPPPRSKAGVVGALRARRARRGGACRAAGLPGRPAAHRAPALQGEALLGVRVRLRSGPGYEDRRRGRVPDRAGRRHEHHGRGDGPRPRAHRPEDHRRCARQERARHASRTRSA